MLSELVFIFQIVPLSGITLSRDRRFVSRFMLRFQMLPLRNMLPVNRRNNKLRRQVRNYPIRSHVFCSVILGKTSLAWYGYGITFRYGKYLCLTCFWYVSGAHQYFGSTKPPQKYKPRFHQTRPIRRRRLGITIGS